MKYIFCEPTYVGMFYVFKGTHLILILVYLVWQRTLSNMRTPSYVGEILCTNIRPGNLPPYIHSMRVLPMDMTEAWAFEIDIEYSGGAVLDIETRLEVHDLDLQQGLMDSNLESSSVEEVTSDLLEGFEHYGKQLNLSEGTVNETEHKDEGDPKLGMNNLLSRSLWFSFYVIEQP